MKPKLLANRELDNYADNDSFDFLNKANAIKYFLEQNLEELTRNNMLVLYGDWGSGKTSLMKYIEQNIDKTIYKSVFFHAWEHEKDENLALSLCDALTEALPKTTNTEIIAAAKAFMRGALTVFKSFASGVTMKMPAAFTGFGLDMEISGEKIIKAFNNELDGEKLSFFKSNEAFKKSFQKIEEIILKSSKAKKLLVFVDDLDRCEPENVLNLITALKLFFTYGKNSVFFCGLDKEAVTKAVKTKYQDVVKAEEYLEKVFDISFNMPKTYSLTKMLEPHFKGGKLSNEVAIATIEDFFKTIDFTTPRHIKKVLSKYEILKSFKALSSMPDNIKALIPNIIEDDNEGNVFETIYCLFFIILYEFHIDKFEELENYDQRIKKYRVIYSETNATSIILVFGHLRPLIRLEHLTK